MSSGRRTQGRRERRRAPPPRPIFGIEIEIFVKVKRAVEDDVIRARERRALLPGFWQQWDFDLSNAATTSRTTLIKQMQQRNHVKAALTSCINDALGHNSGWKVVGDASLQEHRLSVAPDARRWWGVEIISPPISVSKRWQSEIRAVFDAIGDQFDLWTHPATSCHVHVSPGKDSKTKYTALQLTKVAKGALYWEKAFVNLLPHDRRANNYAKPNNTAFAQQEYRNVKTNGWGPVFKKIDNEMARFENHQKGQKFCFCVKFAGGHLHHANAKYRKERYLSTNFLPFTRIGTVELRRQGGVASAESAIHRALMAVTLHVSARRYKFSRHKSRKTHPTTDELISELAGCIKKLPRTCHGSRFVKYLKDCKRDYASDEPMTEMAVNRHEQLLHDDSGTSVFSVASRPRTATGFSGGASQPQYSRPIPAASYGNSPYGSAAPPPRQQYQGGGGYGGGGPVRIINAAPGPGYQVEERYPGGGGGY